MLSAARKREIEGRVNRLLDFCGCRSHPLPVNLNLPLTYLHFSVHSGEEVPCSCMERDFAPTIYLPAQLGECRKRFRIAHEIAHQYLKHYGQKEATLDSSDQNREANYFAACLLMPATMFEQEWEDAVDFGRGRLTRVAEIFQVSPQSAGIRARELGLDRKSYF